MYKVPKNVDFGFCNLYSTRTDLTLQHVYVSMYMYMYVIEYDSIYVTAYQWLYLIGTWLAHFLLKWNWNNAESDETVIFNSEFAY